MSRFSLSALALCSALVVACATPLQRPDSPSADEVDESGAPSAASPIEPTPPPFDWLAERDRIVAALDGDLRIDAQLRDDGSLLLRLPAAEGFRGNSAEPTDSLRENLDRVAEVLTEVEETEIKVLGHTDSIGSELHNLALSIRRAEAVMEYLRARGIALGRLIADGRGESEPIADNADEAGRALNRRVEIVVRPF